MTPLDWAVYGVCRSISMPSDCRYSVNFLKVDSPPPFVRNRFTCLPDSISLAAFHYMTFSRASDSYFNMYSSLCLVPSSMKSSIYQPPPMAVPSGLHMSECTSCSGSVAWEVVFRVKGFRPNLHLLQYSQLHLLGISGPVAMTFGKLSKAFRPACTMQWCDNIFFSASCRHACPVFLSARRQLSMLTLVYLVDSGARYRTRSRTRPHRPEVQSQPTCHDNCRGCNCSDSPVQLWRPSQWSETVRWDRMIAANALLFEVWSFLSFHLVVDKST